MITFSFADQTDLMDVWEMIKEQKEIYKRENLKIWNDDYPEYDDLLDDFHNNNLFVLKDDGQIVSSISKTSSLIEDGNGQLGILYLTRFIVKPLVQNHGYGKTVIKFIEEWALNNGFSTIEFLVSDKNTQAICFYQKRAFLNMGIYKTPWENGQQHYYRFEKKITTE
ncbi:MAG: GNAT family N-acetyltransferase [Bacilli bacterium]